MEPDRRLSSAVDELAKVRLTRSQFVALVAAFALTVAGVVLAELGQRSADAETTPLPDTRQDLGVPGLARLQSYSDQLAAVAGRLESQVSRHSLLTERLAAPVQRFLGERAGGGNEQVYFGREGWLFFAADVEHVTGRPFLGTAHLRQRLEAGVAMPDPVLGVLTFAAELRRHGISLVLVPVASKATIYPQQLSRRSRDTRPRNPSFERFLAELADARLMLERYQGLLPDSDADRGWFASVRDAVAELAAAAGGELPPVSVVDSASALGALGEVPAFLRTDTHWTPAGADAVAAATARAVHDVLRSEAESLALRRRPVPVSQRGDIAVMAQFQGERWHEEVVTQQVVAGNRLAASGKEARVLLLGDSFSNVFSLDRMGWGEGAGFAEQLAFHLGETVSWIARNADGAQASRGGLQQAVGRGDVSLANTEVVVWQFAVRELSIGDWSPTPLDEAPDRNGDHRPRRLVTVPPGEVIEVTGTVRELSRPPLADSVPYRDHVSYLHLTDIASTSDLDEGEMLVALLSMEAGQWTAAARLRAGERATFVLRNYAEVDAEARVSRLSATDLDSEIMFETPNWGELVDPPAPSGGRGPSPLLWVATVLVVAGVSGAAARASRSLPVEKSGRQ